MLNFRRKLKTEFGLPVKIDMPLKYFLLDKNPYRSFHFSDKDKKRIILLFCRFISELKLKVINTVIVKSKLKSQKFDILDTSLTYSIQRIENDLEAGKDPENRFIIITDPGRVGKMRKTTRKIQQINYIPSRFSKSQYRKEIKYLIEIHYRKIHMNHILYKFPI